MSLLKKPSLTKIESFLDSQRAKDFSYPRVGGTREQPPEGFNVDRNRVLLGTGEPTYRAACQALERWQMFPADWTEIYPRAAKLQPGTVVAMLADCLGKWWLNSCRIVYTFDERGTMHRFGFAYGTLPDHVESGEERFTVEWDENNRVWYEIYSFSWPRHWLVRLAYPLARWQQKRFVTDSMMQMRKIVASAVDTYTDEGSHDAHHGVPVG